VSTISQSPDPDEYRTPIEDDENTMATDSGLVLNANDAAPADVDADDED
jgi:hypothetical protein